MEIRRNPNDLKKCADHFGKLKKEVLSMLANCDDTVVQANDQLIGQVCDTFDEVIESIGRSQATKFDVALSEMVAAMKSSQACVQGSKDLVSYEKDIAKVYSLVISAQDAGIAAIGNEEHVRAWVQSANSQRALVKAMHTAIKSMLSSGQQPSTEDIHGVAVVVGLCGDQVAFKAKYLTCGSGATELGTADNGVLHMLAGMKTVLSDILKAFIKSAWSSLCAHPVLGQLILGHQCLDSNDEDAKSPSDFWSSALPRVAGGSWLRQVTRSLQILKWRCTDSSRSRLQQAMTSSRRN